MTLSLAPASLSIKCQWDLLNSHLEATPFSSGATTPSWLNSIEKPVLLTLLAKLRSELDLLRSEGIRPYLPSRKDSGIQMHDDHVATPSPCHLTTWQATTNLVTDFDRANGSFSASRRNRNADRLETKIPNNGDGGFRLPEQLSPLSPTFGPRKGSIPIGTVARRKPDSVAFNNISSDEIPDGAQDEPESYTSPKDTATNENHSGAVTEDINMMRRMLWVAAWLEVERHLEHWVFKFGRVWKERGNRELWREMIKLQNEKAELKYALGYPHGGYESAL